MSLIDFTLSQGHSYRLYERKKNPQPSPFGLALWSRVFDPVPSFTVNYWTDWFILDPDPISSWTVKKGTSQPALFFNCSLLASPVCKQDSLSWTCITISYYSLFKDLQLGKAIWRTCPSRYYRTWPYVLLFLLFLLILFLWNPFPFQWSQWMKWNPYLFSSWKNSETLVGQVKEKEPKIDALDWTAKSQVEEKTSYRLPFPSWTL